VGARGNGSGHSGMWCGSHGKRTEWPRGTVGMALGRTSAQTWMPTTANGIKHRLISFTVYT